MRVRASHILFLAVSFVFSIARAAPNAASEMEPDDAGIPLAKSLLDRKIPDDPLEFHTIRFELGELGFHRSAVLLNDFSRRRDIAAVRGTSLSEVRTMRDVIRFETSATTTVTQDGAALVAEGFTLDFHNPVDDATLVPKNDNDAPHDPSAILKQLQPGLWGIFDKDVVEQIPDRATYFYLFAKIRNNTAVAADVGLFVSLRGIQESLSCKLKDIKPGVEAQIACLARPFGNPEKTDIPLEDRVRRKIFNALKDLQNNPLAQSPVGLRLSFGTPPKVVDEDPRYIRGGAWLQDQNQMFTAHQDALRILRTASCDELGICKKKVLNSVFSPAVGSIALFLAFMGCFVVARMRGVLKAWPSFIFKIYAIAVAATMVISIWDSRTGPAPLHGVLAFLAKSAMSLPWSYFLIVTEPAHKPFTFLNDTQIGESSPLFWVFIFVNLFFLAFMALPNDKNDTEE